VDLSTGRFVKRAEKAQQGALTAAARADHRREITGRHRKADVDDCMNLDTAGLEGPRYVGNSKHHSLLITSAGRTFAMSHAGTALPAIAMTAAASTPYNT